MACVISVCLPGCSSGSLWLWSSAVKAVHSHLPARSPCRYHPGHATHLTGGKKQSPLSQYPYPCVLRGPGGPKGQRPGGAKVPASLPTRPCCCCRGALGWRGD